MALGILQQIGHRLRHQFAIAVDEQARFDRPRQAAPLFLHGGRIAFGQIGDQRAQIEPREQSPDLPALDFGNAQDRGEQRQNFVDPFDPVGDHRALGYDLAWRAAALFQRIAKPGQRGAQIMRHIARHLAQIVEQALDHLEHRIEHGSELVEFVMALADRHSPAEIAAADRFRRAADRGQPPPQITAEQQRAAKPQRNDREESGDKGDQHGPVDPLDPFSIGGNHQPAMVGQVDRQRAPGVRAFGRIGEVDVLPARTRHLGIE